jgi:hypothetical protein
MRPSKWLAVSALACAASAGSIAIAACPDLDGDSLCDISVLRGRVTRNLVGAQTFRGKIGLQGEFFTDPLNGDVFDVSADIVVHITDGLSDGMGGGLDRTFTWSPADCAVFVSSGHTRCTTPDGKAKVLFVSLRRTPQMFSFKINAKELDTVAPFLKPLTLTLTHGSPPIVREGALDECKSTSKGMNCRQPREPGK